MATDVIGGGNIEPRALEDEMRSAYLDYAMSVIVGRALPDVRDGLKPVHRRVLYSMRELGLGPTRPYSKSSRIVGDVMGKYHPHGDAAIYDALVRMAQDFSMRYELIDGQGNFGSVDDDPAAAMRYCVTGDTRVATSRGTVRIDSIVPGADPESDTDLDLDVLDRLGRPVRASKFFHSGEHPTLQLRTKEGFELSGTHNHPVLTLVDMAGVPLLMWKLLEELRPGDQLAMLRDWVPDEIESGGAAIDWLARDSAYHPERGGRYGTSSLELVRADEVRQLIDTVIASDYYYATVESVTDAGVQPVYSLRVDSDDHSFLTNGFVSHNTEARLSRVAMEMLRDLDMDTVDFAPNYDGSQQEPLVLPSRLPNLLINGSAGIAVGMATNIPPHNLREVIGATIAFIEDRDIDVAGLMKHIKGPDFPTGGIILGRAGIRDAYETGRGRVRVQARAHIEPLSHGKEAIIVTELPYQVKKGGDAGLIKKIADLVHEKRIPEISDLRDESDKHGMRLVIELKRDAIPKVVLNKLYKHTAMQTTFGVNMVALVDNVPRTLDLRTVLQNYVEHQRDVVVRRSKFELAQLEARVHVLEGLLIALDNLDAVIELIRSSRDRETAREELVTKFELTVVQASAILDLRLSQLTALESDAIKQEHADKLERIRELRDLLGDEDKVLGLIREELSEIRDRFGDERRTEITHSDDEIDIEDLIADQQMVIAITHSGYIKSLPLTTYRQQQRGGRGVTGMDMKDEDFIEHLFISSTHDYLLFFTNRGMVYRSKVYELPEASRTAKGRALVNVLPLREGERVQSVLATRDFTEGRYLVFATRQGMVKKTEFSAYNTRIEATGIIAINIRDDDELVAVRRTSGDDDILMVSRSGQAARFHESQVRAMGRDTSGVRGMNVSRKGNAVIAMDVARDDQELLVVTENGYGKRTSVSDYPRKGRATMGVKTIALTDRKGALAGALVVREHEELLFISQAGMVQRTTVRGINLYGRASQGVKLMNLRDEDVVSAVALVVDNGEQTAAPVAENGAPPGADGAEGDGVAVGEATGDGAQASATKDGAGADGRSNGAEPDDDAGPDA
ncbi:MAG TPA: DNA gyrase subunit A [Solirubrobacteraceae bacterium]|nr:DNA gyrase subunit A [Solirubrobacteraceae bacterium]